MTSILFLAIFSSIVFSGLCSTTFSNEHKIIKTKHGVYDCVDFYKQPAFKHPLLKHHTSKVLPKLLEELQEKKVYGFGLEEGDCPIGTVPILRTTQNSTVGSLQPPRPKLHCVALVHTNNLNRKFFGAGGTPIIYKPRIYTNDQISTTRIKLSNGEDSFEAGWMVNPNVFHDNESHLYASFSAQGKGCINLQCPGFVQVATDVALGMVPSAYSVIGGQQLGWNLSIVKSEEDEYWWLFIGAEKKAIGYWPKELFIPLALVASKVEWVGEVYDFGSNSSSTPLPNMGNGLKARDEPPYYSGAILHVTYVDVTFKNVLYPEDTNKVWDCDPYYTVLDHTYKDYDSAQVIFYGGTS